MEKDDMVIPDIGKKSQNLILLASQTTLIADTQNLIYKMLEFIINYLLKIKPLNQEYPAQENPSSEIAKKDVISNERK